MRMRSSKRDPRAEARDLATARLNSDARVFGLECHLAQLESEIMHFHGFDTAVFLRFPSENDALRSDLLDYSCVRSICGCP